MTKNFFTILTEPQIPIAPLLIWIEQQTGYTFIIEYVTMFCIWMFCVINIFHYGKLWRVEVKEE